MYREYPPGPALADTVECFWSSEAGAPAGAPVVHRVLPDGCMDLLFDFTAAAGRRASIVGTMSRPLLVPAEGRTDLFGVRFRPGGLTSLLALDAAELADARADLSCFAGSAAEELWECLAAADSLGRVAIMEGALRARGPGDGVDPVVRHCVARIEGSRGALPIAGLERSTGLSGRQIERRFARHIGLAPKSFARIVRFKSLLLAAAAPGRRDWAGLAAACGFADQPHLVREFRAFSGLPPSGYFGARPGDVGFVQDEADCPG